MAKEKIGSNSKEYSKEEEDILSKYPPGKLDFILESSPDLSINEIDSILSDLIDQFGYNRIDIFEDINKFLYANPDLGLIKLKEICDNDPLFFSRIPNDSQSPTSRYSLERVYYPYFGHVEGRTQMQDSIGEDLTAAPRPLEEKLQNALPRIRYDLKRILKYFKMFRDNAGSEYDEFIKKHPEYEKNIDKAVELAEKLTDPSLTDEEIIEKIMLYNDYVSKINGVISAIKGEKNEREQRFIENLQRGEINIAEALTVEDKQELNKFAKDLWDEMFPESYTDQAVKYYTGQEELDPYQKYLLALPNAFEYALTGAASLADPDTYRELFDMESWSQTLESIDMIWNLPWEDKLALYDACKYMVQNLDVHSEVNKAVSIIIGIFLLKGGFAKLGNYAKKLGYSDKLVKIIKKTYAPVTAYKGLSVGKRGVVAVPLAVIGGITLPYLSTNL
ncbi:hypothetical protein GF354_00090 [Candidatus Peregrinibacteria bacterium]|nr:hypothetical protein [Candidatus Peregrinibacteria bacterium]